MSKIEIVKNFLFDRTAPSPELLCAIHTIPNVTIIGEISAEIFTFGAGQRYVLQKSLIPVLLPDRIVTGTSFSAGESPGRLLIAL